MLKTKQIHDQNLLSYEAIAQCDVAFIHWLETYNPNLAEELMNHRQGKLMSSESLITLAESFENFVAGLMGIEHDLAIKRAELQSDQPIMWMKYSWWPKYIRTQLKKPPEMTWEECLTHWEKNIEQPFNEYAVASWCLDNPEAHWWHTACVWLHQDDTKRALVDHWQLFKRPEKIDYDALFSYQKEGQDISVIDIRERSGFQLTDRGQSSLAVNDAVHYCALCHQTKVDYCRSGFHQKKGQPSSGYRKNPLNTPLQGCPLDEKISETHALRRSGGILSALAMIMMDNPLCPATGHRICNDCMQSCIYQKQTPVNIPEVESRILMDVLTLPWGIELYFLLLRWNPLRPKQYLPQPVSGDHVLVMGQGPAGFTMAYHLLMAGVQVTGMDGLAIESLPEHWLNKPIKSWNDFAENLEERPVRGFGGVAEYGITVRWNKNFLTLIHMCLARMKHFSVMGGVRFGGTITLDDAKRLGFDHVALALGAGLPKELKIKGSLTPGMRQANDFLMMLQLSGAVKDKASVDLQVRMPAIVIGGGLTGVDAATELQAYYWHQIKQVSERIEAVVQVRGQSAFWQSFSPSERSILEEMQQHWQAFTSDRHHRPRSDWIKQWGGVRIVYRKRMIDSPAYRTNPHELYEALREGLMYVEQLSPDRTIQDAFGHVKACVFQQTRCENGVWSVSDDEVTLAARTILVATGARPNIAYHFEHPGELKKQGAFYQIYSQEDDSWQSFEHQPDQKIAKGVMSSQHEGMMSVSILGDLHPHYHGSVVKAMASAKNHYEDILATLPQKPFQGFKGHDIHDSLSPTIHKIEPFGSGVRITIHAKAFVARYQIGQFYRLSQPGSTQGHINLWPDHVDVSSGLLTFTLDEMTHKRLDVASWQIGMAVHLMGPSGVRMRIPDEKTEVLIVADALHALKAVAMARAMKKAKHVVWLYLEGDIEDTVLSHHWFDVCDGLATEKNWQIQGAIYHPRITQQDFFSTILPSWSQNKAIDLVLTLSRWPWLRKTTDFLKQAPGCLSDNVSIKAAVHGPMQCMLKGICAQCLQWQIDPETGERKKAVYACSWQDQPIDLIDWQAFDDRFEQHGAVKRLHDQYHHFISVINDDIEVTKV